jgi:thiol-disulfide isomerase/thioredoxin
MTSEYKTKNSQTPITDSDSRPRRQWLKGAGLLAATAGIAGLAGVGASLWRAHSEPTALSPEAMNTLWSSSFEGLDGQSTELAQFKGKPLVINFWATWCMPCVEEMPLLNAFYQQNASKSWQVIGLAIDQPSSVRKFLARHPVDYPIFQAGLLGTELTKTLGDDQEGLPFTIVLNAQGQLKQRKLGRLSPSEINTWTA